MRNRIRVAGLSLAALAALLILVVAAIWLARAPRATADWVVPHRVAPRVVVRGERVEIDGFRDFAWLSDQNFDVRYARRTVDLRRLDSVWYGVSRFGGIPGLAHAFLSFGFGDEYVAVSVEARREAGESYSPLRGLVDEYELLYVIGTERDVIGLRTHVWQEEVSLYPIRATPAAMRRLFVDIARRAERLSERPESYNTIFSSCSSNLVQHVNTIAPDSIPMRLGVFLPGFSDRVAWEAGLVDTELPFEAAREAFRLDASVRAIPLDEEFSTRIRRGAS